MNCHLGPCYEQSIAVITIPRPLRERLGDEGADALVAVINEASKGQREDIIAFVEERFERRLAEVKADLVRWMFVFWVGQIGVITGILFAFFK